MPRVGEILAGKYRLDKVAGEGGMGIVYAAEHLVLKQRVAVKVLLPEAATSEAQVERFAREARAAARINSEHVARVLDAGSLASGAPFLVMEYLEGCDLDELLDLQRTLPVTEVVDYLLQALEGLAHAHAVNIVHRDLKPANLFLACRPDGSNAIKLLDFGISKTTRSRPEDKRLTGQHVLGSPVYMSPEQLRNATDIDSRADIWSIGIVGYELLTGAPPFDGDGVGEIFAAILETYPVPLTEKNPKIPKELSDIFLRCLRRDPDERWSDAGHLAKALAPFGSDPETPLVERAEQVLARAKMLSVQRTPLETRRVVEAIEAAAERAMTTASKTSPVLPLSTRKPKGVGSLVGSRVASFARRSPLGAGAVAATLAVLLGLSAFGVARKSGTAEAANRTVTQRTSLPNAPQTVRGSETAHAETPAPDDKADAPLLMDLPPTDLSPSTSSGDRASRARGSKTSPGKPQRPRFLNTRE
jgi:eukaryotic-like serine/threonine-protein kinase